MVRPVAFALSIQRISFKGRRNYVLIYGKWGSPTWAQSAPGVPPPAARAYMELVLVVYLLVRRKHRTPALEDAHRQRFFRASNGSRSRLSRRNAIHSGKAGVSSRLVTASHRAARPGPSRARTKIALTTVAFTDMVPLGSSRRRPQYEFAKPSGAKTHAARSRRHTPHFLAVYAIVESLLMFFQIDRGISTNPDVNVIRNWTMLLAQARPFQLSTGIQTARNRAPLPRRSATTRTPMLCHSRLFMDLGLPLAIWRSFFAPEWRNGRSSASGSA